MEMTEVVSPSMMSSRLQIDGKSNRCSDDGKTIQKVVHKLRRLFDNVINGEKLAARSAVIETDYEQRNNTKIPDRVPNVNNYGSYEDMLEYRFSQRISGKLEQLLSANGTDDLNCKLLVPSDLTSRITQDVLCMSQYEPCGVRGCVLFVNMEEKSTCRKIGRIECDPATVATFELYLTLKEDTRPWVMARSMISSFKGRVVDGNSNSVKVLCPGYQLVKRKLYRPN